MEINLVESWLKNDPIRWIAGAAGGLLAGIVMLILAAGLSSVSGMDPLFAVKLGAIPFLKASALELNAAGPAVAVGLVAVLGLAAFLGVVFAHFAKTNSLFPLLGVGLSWGAFSWIFLNNLFFSSWRDYYVAEVPKGAAFLACMVFGASLVSVSFFDRMFRGSRG